MFSVLAESANRWLGKSILFQELCVSCCYGNDCWNEVQHLLKHHFASICLVAGLKVWQQQLISPLPISLKFILQNICKAEN
jgi:hypothetical protein